MLVGLDDGNRDNDVHVCREDHDEAAGAGRVQCMRRMGCDDGCRVGRSGFNAALPSGASILVPFTAILVAFTAVLVPFTAAAVGDASANLAVVGGC